MGLAYRNSFASKIVSSPGGGVGSLFTISFFGDDVASVFTIGAAFGGALVADGTEPVDGPGAAE